jgi:hypothetical protein
VSKGTSPPDPSSLELIQARLRRDRDTRDSVDTLVRDIMKKYEDVGYTPQRVLQDVIIPAFIATPTWAVAGGFKIGVGAVFNAGAFCVYYGKDPETNKYIALVQQRKEKDVTGKHKVGAIGGYTEQPEQPIVGLIRETKQEVCKAKDTGVFEPDPGRYVLISAGKDFTNTAKIPVEYTGYAYELSAEEIKALKKYIKKLDTDPVFKSRVIAASDEESYGFELAPLEKIASEMAKDFKYERQHDVYAEVAARLGVLGVDKQRKRSSSIGYTVGDCMETLKVHLGSAAFNSNQVQMGSAVRDQAVLAELGRRTDTTTTAPHIIPPL